MTAKKGKRAFGVLVPAMNGYQVLAQLEARAGAEEVLFNAMNEKEKRAYIAKQKKNEKDVEKILTGEK